MCGRGLSLWRPQPGLLGSPPRARVPAMHCCPELPDGVPARYLASGVPSGGNSANDSAWSLGKSQAAQPTSKQSLTSVQRVQVHEVGSLCISPTFSVSFAPDVFVDFAGFVLAFFFLMPLPSMGAKSARVSCGLDDGFDEERILWLLPWLLPLLLLWFWLLLLAVVPLVLAVTGAELQTPELFCEFANRSLLLKTMMSFSKCFFSAFEQSSHCSSSVETWFLVQK